MAQSLPQKSILSRVFGNWPRLQIALRGYRYEIVRRGRTVAYGQPRSIDWAMAEIQKPVVLPFRPRLVQPQPKELWQERIESMDARCKEMGRRVAEGRI